MRKNIKNKILLSILAASVFYLPAYADAADLTITAGDDSKPVFNYGTDSGDETDWVHTGSNATYIYHGTSNTGNKITIGTESGTTLDLSDYSYIYGGYAASQSKVPEVSDNKIIINNSISSNGITINGGRSDNNSTNSTNLYRNDVKITGSNFSNFAEIYGANGDSEAMENKVTIADSIFSGNTTIRGGYGKNVANNEVNITGNTSFNSSTSICGGANSSSNGIATTNNKVNISGGTFSGTTNIYASYFYLTSNNSAAEGNSITISGGTFSGTTNVYASYLSGSNNNSAAKGNSITISGNAGGDAGGLSKVNLYGYGLSNINNTSATASNNNLVIDGWSGTVGSVNNFANINFENIKVAVKVDENTTPAASVFNIAATGEGANKNLASTTVNINSVAAGDYEEGTELSGLLTLDKDIDYDKITISDKLAKYTNEYFASDNGDNGVVANTFTSLHAEKLTKENDKDHQVKISAKVDKTILAGKFIEADSEGNPTVHYNSSQTEDTAFLTIGEGFSTNASVIAGAYALGTNDATGGKLIVEGGTITKDLYAGYSDNGSTTGNTLTLTGSADVSNVNLYGGNSADAVTGNTLIVDAWKGEVKSLHNFATIDFNNIAWEKDSTVLTIADSTADLSSTAINLNSINFAGNSNISAGESMTFITGSNLGIDAEQVKEAQTFTAGVALVGTGALEVDSNNVKYTITSVGLNEQTDIVAETHAAAAAFLNQSTDLISDSLDVLGRDGTYGVKTFAAVQGNRSTYDVADDVKINGWSVIAGFGAENEHKGGDFAWGVFYENGSGNYRTYNTFNNEFFRGDGSMVYNGGGIAARYENAKGVYTEGSLRAGTLKNEMDNALRDASGASYGYETESTYYGAHIGVGQIFELGENTDLGVYGKFFHTYVEGDSVTIGGDTFDFDSITSDRLRVGARVTKQQAKVNTYYGLAYEYEFNGDVDMTAAGIKADTQSFGGGSGIAELGFNYQPGTDSPWNFDLNLRGYVGERQGGSFNVQATYTF